MDELSTQYRENVWEKNLFSWELFERGKRKLDNGGFSLLSFKMQIFLEWITLYLVTKKMCKIKKERQKSYFFIKLLKPFSRLFTSKIACSFNMVHMHLKKKKSIFTEVIKDEYIFHNSLSFVYRFWNKYFTIQL